MRTKAKTLIPLLVALLPLTATGQIINTIAGNGTVGYNGDNITATSAELNRPYCIALDDSGNVYTGEFYGFRIRKINAKTNIITTIAGTGMAGYNGDGISAFSAEIGNPSGIAIDSLNNIYFTDVSNNRIRKIGFNGIISTIGGNGTQGFSGDNGPATSAEIYQPHFIAVDKIGNVYFTDSDNQRVRKISTTGIITTIAGTGSIGYTGDNGPATAAELNFPTGICVDKQQNIYITDENNNCVRKITAATGIISTIAGNGTNGFSGDNGPAIAAELNSPWGLCMDVSGNVYISDNVNFRVRMINTSGIISTIAGNGTSGFSGDGGLATSAELALGDVSVDHLGNIYVADGDNARIRKITSSLGIYDFLAVENLRIFPNPSDGLFMIDWKEGDVQGMIEVYNLLGEKATNNSIPLKQGCNKIDLNSLVSGIYILKIISNLGTFVTTGKVIIK